MNYNSRLLFTQWTAGKKKRERERKRKVTWREGGLTEEDDVVQAVATVESWVAGVAAARVAGATAVAVDAGVACGLSG
jgi:beta-phosphoglucomutase-like phosphatase (HAD superfamily)